MLQFFLRRVYFMTRDSLLILYRHKVRFCIRLWPAHNNNSEQHIYSRAGSHFRQLFRNSRQAGVMKSMRPWLGRDSFIKNQEAMSLRGTISSITKVTDGGVMWFDMKSERARGRLVGPLTDSLHGDLRAEFDRYGRVWLKFNYSVLSSLAHMLL